MQTYHFTSSGTFQRSSAPPQSPSFISSVNFQTSAFFFNTNFFTHTATASPLATLHVGESYSVTLIRSFSQSASVYSGTTVSWTEFRTITLTFSSITYIEQEIRTRSVVMVHTIMYSMVAVPVYVRTVVSVRVAVRLTTESQNSKGINSAMLVAVASGSAAVVATLAGMAVFIVRQHRLSSGLLIERTDNGSDTGESSSRLYESAIRDFEPATEEVEMAHGRRLSVTSRQKESSDGSGSLSSVDPAEKEDIGLYV
jgi:hypothetical protein